MRLLDKRFSGIARGVGTAKILGRVHSAQLKLADLFLPCSFTIMEVSSLAAVVTTEFLTHLQGRDVDLLFGLDMLKAHQACIDLEKSVLRIQGREVSFLAEHELPEKARDRPNELLAEGTPGAEAGPSTGMVPAAPEPQHFPGSGHTIGAPPQPGRGRGAPAAGAGPAEAKYPEEHVKTLMDFGVSREVAISTLDAAGGNLDMAASLLF